jgi:hypothetical protein
VDGVLHCARPAGIIIRDEYVFGILNTMRTNLLILLLTVSGCLCFAQTNPVPEKASSERMRDLRLQALESATNSIVRPTADYPLVRGVLMDWSVEKGTISVVSFSNGEASAYTTGSFGVKGRMTDENVRLAAQSFVKAAGRHYNEGVLTQDFPYPKAGRVRFYLICYDGVRVIDADLEAVRNGEDKYSDLYAEGQNVITELRLASQKRKGDKP